MRVVNGKKERREEGGPLLRPSLRIEHTKAGGKIKMECIFETLSFNNHITILVIFTINIQLLLSIRCKCYIKKISVLRFLKL